MANAFVEYFHNVGRIFTEKNAWYRILTFLVINAIYQFCINSFTRSLGNSSNAVSLNVPLLILTILSAILLLGYGLLLFSDRMNKQDNLVPKIDFLQMFTVGLRSIPFYIVWIIYYFITTLLLSIVLGILFALIGGLLHFMHVPQIAIVTLLAIPLIVVALLIAGPWFSVMAVFSKDFSYQKVLNPMLYFKLFPKTAFQIFGVWCGFAILILLFIALGVMFYLPISMTYSSLQPEMQFISMALAGALLGYILQVFGFAYSCSVADITSEAIGDDDDTSADRKSTDNTVVDIEYENKDE